MNLYDIDSEKLHEHFSFKVDLGQNPLRVDKFLMLRVENVTRNKIIEWSDINKFKIYTKDFNLTSKRILNLIYNFDFYGSSASKNDRNKINYLIYVQN